MLFCKYTRARMTSGHRKKTPQEGTLLVAWAVQTQERSSRSTLCAVISFRVCGRKKYLLWYPYFKGASIKYVHNESGAGRAKCIHSVQT